MPFFSSPLFLLPLNPYVPDSQVLGPIKARIWVAELEWRVWSPNHMHYHLGMCSKCELSDGVASGSLSRLGCIVYICINHLTRKGGEGGPESVCQSVSSELGLRSVLIKLLFTFTISSLISGSRLVSIFPPNFFEVQLTNIIVIWIKCTI